jgi:hypothetical protein
MPMDRFFIGPFDKNSGLQNDVKPYLIPDQAFARCDNGYVWRGRVRKRFGSEWLSATQQSTRLRMSVGTLATPLTLPIPTLIGAIGQMFSVADVLFTVNIADGNLLVANGTATTATFDTAAGTFVFAGVNDSLGNPVPTTTNIYFYPALPVMGLISWEQDIVNDDITVAFDTRFSYLYTTGIGWDRITGEGVGNAGASIWAGSNSQFFWGANYGNADAAQRALYVTNFNQNEQMRYLLLVAGVPTWFFFRPPINATNYLQSAQMLVPFKNRLVAFNIWEFQPASTPNLVNYPFRARWPTEGDPTDPDAWREDIPGKGTGRDCPINQAIITSEFVKDRLILYLEKCTWEFVYTGNDIYPFQFQQINTELGAEGTFSVVPFDKVALGIAQNGIHACTGTNVDRIDTDIPEEVFNISNQNFGTQRVYGIRDYFTEMVYWAFPNQDSSAAQPYPTKILAYNYKTNTWSFNDDSITCFGYFYPQSGILWSSTTVTWAAQITWGSGQVDQDFQKVIAGNQEGWTFFIERDIPRNAPALQITDIVVAAGFATVTVIDNNLRAGDFIYLEGITGTGTLTSLNNTTVEIELVPLQNTFVFGTTFTGVYSGGGTIRRVSRLDILTKEFNFYLKDGSNVAVSEIDFQVDASPIPSQGQIAVDYYVSTNDLSMTEAAIETNTIMGTGVLETFPYPDVPFEAFQSRLVHPMYIQADGEFIQLRLYLNDAQMLQVIQTSPGVYSGPAFVDFQMHAMTFFAQKSSSRMRG